MGTWDDEDFAKARKLMEQAADRGANKLARLLGYDDAEEAVERLGKGRDRDRAPDRDRDDRRRRDDDGDDKERKARDADQKRAADEAAAAKKKADDEAEAARKAELKRITDEADARAKAIERRAQLREDLLDLGVKRDRLDRVLKLYDADFEALPEADRAKGLDLKAFAKSLAADAPGVFAEGRAPKDEPPPDDKGQGGDKDKEKAPSTGPGTGRGEGKPGERGAQETKSFANASPREVNEALRQGGFIR